MAHTLNTRETAGPGTPAPAQQRAEVPMASWGSYSFLFGPLVSIAVLLVLVVLLRWTFSRGSSLVRGPARPGRPDQYGLLVPVATPATVIEAEMIRRRLQDAGVRSTLAETTQGPRVMVFRNELLIAEHVLAGGR